MSKATDGITNATKTLIELVYDKYVDVDLNTLENLITVEKADVNAIDNGWSVLMRATTRDAGQNTKDVISCLVKNNADINYQNDRYCVLSRAAISHGPDILELLCNEKTTRSILSDALEEAKYNGNVDAQIFLENKLLQLEEDTIKKISQYEEFKDDPKAQRVAALEYLDYIDHGGTLTQRTLSKLQQRLTEKQDILSTQQREKLWEIFNDTDEYPYLEIPTTQPTTTPTSVDFSDLMTPNRSLEDKDSYSVSSRS